MKKLLLLVMASLCLSCTDKKPFEIVNYDDYKEYLQNPDSSSEIEKERSFWLKKLTESPNQTPYLSKLASCESQLFEKTGDISHLVKAGEYLENALSKTDSTNSGVLRSLARNYISQHKFKEANELVNKALELGDRKKDSQKMAFDVALELGDVARAKTMLDSIAHESDFDYLIRLSKWYDHNGNLPAAITNLQLALTKAEELQDDNLKLWGYTNIADFYGHAGELENSYQYYLKALELDAKNYYALKGIAWIAFSCDRNPEKAIQILDYITQHYKAPDYYLLKSEIAQFQGNGPAYDKNLSLFLDKVSDTRYGDMYNKYLILIDPKKYLSLAQKEVKNRPTTASYDLLSWSLFQNNEKEKALEIASENVFQKTSEPEALFHLAQIFKANNLKTESKALKKELKEATFELGPLLALEINKL